MNEDETLEQAIYQDMERTDFKETIKTLVSALCDIRNACTNGGEPEISWIFDTCNEALRGIII